MKPLRLSIRPRHFILCCAVLACSLLRSSIWAEPRATAGSSSAPKIAFVSNRDVMHRQIYLMNPDGSSQTRVTNSPRDDDEPSLRPQGDKIAFYRADPNGPDFAFHIYTINANGTGETQLTHEYEFRPSFSPDGSKIVFVAQRAADNFATKIYVMDSDGSNQLRISEDTPVQDLDPSFSADGTKIVFSSGYPVGFVSYQGIFTMNANGSNRRRLSNHPPGQIWGDRRPAFSPDGSKIVFETTPPNGGGVYAIAIMNADGTGRTVFNGPANNSRPSFSPDGSKIVFHAFEAVGSGTDQIYAMNLDGTNVQNISNSGEHDFEPSWTIGPTTSDLRIVSVTHSPDPVQNNGDITYNFAVQNNGPDVAPFTRVLVTISNATYSGSNVVYAPSGNGHAFFLGSIASGQTSQFRATFTAHQPPPSQPQTVQLGSSISSNSVDPAPNNNVGSAMAVFAPPPAPAPPGDLTPTAFVVNESLAPTPNTLAGTVLRFAAGQGTRASGTQLRVQQSTTPGDEGSWVDIGGGGLMMLEASSYDPTDDLSHQIYALNSTAYLNANGVYFRAIASAPGHPDRISNIVPPLSGAGLNLASSMPRLEPTVFRISGLEVPFGVLPGQRIPFLAVQPSYQVPGLEVRVQRSATPRDELSWSTLPGGTMTTACTPDVDPNFCRKDGTTNFFHVRSSNYESGEIYFRAISFAPGYVDSISRPIGPFTLTRDELPFVLLTPPTGPALKRKGIDGTGEPIIVTINATDPDGFIARVDLYADGRPFLTRSSPPWEFDIQSLPVGWHTLDALGWDNVGGVGFSNHIPTFYLGEAGGVSRLRIANGAWNDPTGWNPPGVPGTLDSVQIHDHSVELNGASVSCRSIDVQRSLLSGPGSLTVSSSFFVGAGGAADLLDLTLNIPVDAQLVVDGTDSTGPGVVTFKNVTVNNHGYAILNGSRFDGRTSLIHNHGTTTFGDQLRQGLVGRPTITQLGTVNNHGTFDTSGAVTHLQSPLVLHPGSNLIVGVPIVAGGGGNIVAGGGGNIVAGGGMNLIGQDGAALIGNDGAGLIGLDGASVVSNDGAGLLPVNGLGIVAGGGGNRIPHGTSQPLVQLLGGTLSGAGAIQGDVLNTAGSVSVGGDVSSALAVNGTYTQGSMASLVMDFSGHNGQAGQYDLLKVAGSAALAGTLDIGAAPATSPGETTIVPLSYESVAGSFSVVGSGTQVTFNPTGALVTVTPAVPVTIVTALSRKTHGATAFDLPLNLTGPRVVEPRSGGAAGNHTLVFTFSSDIASGNAAVTSGTGSVNGTPVINGNSMAVNLTGVSNQQVIKVNLNNVTGTNAQVMADTELSLGLLLGDANGNGTVNATDIGQVKAVSGQPVTAANFRADVNANGSINATDIGQVKSQSGNVLPLLR